MLPEVTDKVRHVLVSQQPRNLVDLAGGSQEMPFGLQQDKVVDQL